VEKIIEQFKTFSYEQERDYLGLIKGKPLLVVYARGGEYTKGTESEAFDLQSKYVELILSFIGFTDIRSIVVEPTLQGGPYTARQKVDTVVKKAEQLASSF